MSSYNVRGEERVTAAEIRPFIYNDIVHAFDNYYNLHTWHFSG